MEEEGRSSSLNHSPKKEIKREKQLMLVISEQFLEEKSTLGDEVSLFISWTLCTTIVVAFCGSALCYDVAVFMLYSSSWTDGT